MAESAVAGGSPKKRLFLFDVDGTLCESQLPIQQDMLDAIKKLAATKGHVGVVSGSDKAKVLKQFQVPKLDDLYNQFGVRFGFFENGVMAYDLKTNEVINEDSVVEFLGEEKYQDLVNDVLRWLSEIRLPIKRDLMIETRSGNINVSPIGRSCTRAERLDFAAFDTKHCVRQKLANQILEKYGSDLSVTLGGQISIDICPKGWTKAVVMGPKILGKIGCVDPHDIVFFGDRCGTGGNDKPLYDCVPRGVWVKDHADTLLHLRGFLAD